MKISSMMRGAALIAAAAISLCGCSSSNPSVDDSGGPVGGGPSSETIQGIATPSSVSVVTATNAN